MKKIELNAPLRFILVILIWLLTFTVVNLAGALNNGGAGLIGTLVLYIGVLYLAFCYFNDCALKKACRFSLITMAILVVVNLFISSYEYIIRAFEITNESAIKVNTIITNLFYIGRNVTMALCLLITLVKAANASCEGECCCKKEAKEEAPKAETKEVETKEEAKEEAASEKEAE